jgi:DNA-binding XRE family transcriptional regulator
MNSNLPDQAVNAMLARLGEVSRQARIEQKRTQTEQAALAEISLRAAQNIEAGQSGQTAILFKYLFSLGLLDALYSALPDPQALSPLEQLAMAKDKPVRPQRVSRNRGLPTDKKQPKWGDEHAAPETKKGKD